MQRDGGVTGASGLNRRTAPTMEGQLMNMLHKSGVVVASSDRTGVPWSDGRRVLAGRARPHRKA